MGRPRKDRSAEERHTTTRRAQSRTAPQAGYQGKLYVPSEVKHQGFVYRWVRTTNRNQPDQNNVRDAMQAGWQIVPQSDWTKWSPPDMTQIFGPTSASAIIDAGGLVLMRRDQRTHDAEKKRLYEASQQQIRAARRDKDGPGADPRMPTFDESRMKYSPISEDAEIKPE